MSSKIGQLPPPQQYTVHDSIYIKFKGRQNSCWVVISGEHRVSRDHRGWVYPQAHGASTPARDPANSLLISRVFSVQLLSLWCSAPQILAPWPPRALQQDPQTLFGFPLAELRSGNSLRAGRWSNWPAHLFASFHGSQSSIACYNV